MTREELERRLRHAPTYDAWVVALAEFFDAHGLVFGHGTDNSADEAFWLVRHLQSWQDGIWEEHPDATLLPAVSSLAVERVTERKPLAYLIGEAWFANLKFKVNEHVLVPRSPLAEVVERGFAPWCELAPGDRVLDVGTGSGCIAIATARYCPDAVVDATDVSAEALAVAAENVALHDVGGRVHLYRADVFPPGDARYRVIISNPPYVPEREVAQLPAEYRAEPAVGLAGGATGFAIVERLLAGAARRLVPGGVLIVEVGAGQEAFAAAHPELPLVWLTFERGGDGVFVLTAEQLSGRTPQR
jgi:ribosomal protein L3 glutamine methyltransferase